MGEMAGNVDIEYMTFVECDASINIERAWPKAGKGGESR